MQSSVMWVAHDLGGVRGGVGLPAKYSAVVLTTMRVDENRYDMKGERKDEMTTNEQNGRAFIESIPIVRVEIDTKGHGGQGQQRTGGTAAVMALNRECEMVQHSDITHECAGSRPSPPENLVSTVSRAVRREQTWNN